MLKVVSVVDKQGTAIDRLAQGMAKFHHNLDYRVVDVHPKRPDARQLAEFEAAAKDADILDWQYFKTADMLRGRYDWLADKKHMLTHHNPYSIETDNWNSYDMVVANNKYIYERLGNITERPVEYVGNTIDTDFWTFNPDWQPNKNVLMVANRIESKKGILPIAIACAELNLHFILVGSISDVDYFESIMQSGPVEFHNNISDEKLRELYYKSTLHVCNSVDNFESGTLPMLEAMLTGVPVLTRRIGHVPELNNSENMAIYDGDPEDVVALVEVIHAVTADKKKLETMRDKGWNTAKARSHERRAYQYQKLYRQLLHGDQLPVSVVVPIYERPEVTRQCFEAIVAQTHKNIELIVPDDNPNSNVQMVYDFAKYVGIPVRYIHTAASANDYGLARGRNIATIEATGEVMVYCDQRMVMEPDAIANFLKYIKPKHWLYGNKNAGKKEFVENFSCIYRQDVINAGMFCERMDAYGGLSQETRTRVRNQGVQVEYVESARAIPHGKSSNRNRKRQEIIKMKNRLYKMGLE
jgi:glycosyltransferase involved in cell wall biosynthesis